MGRADDGTRWVTTITAAGAPTPGRRRRRRRRRSPPPSSVTVRAGPPGRVVVRAGGAGHQGHARRVRRAGSSKVVLAREVRRRRPTCPFDRAVVLARLRRAYPGCFLFPVDGFVGASPELLVGRTGDVVRAQPMAGTAPRGGDPAADARLAASLLASPTYRHEHQITIDMVLRHAARRGARTSTTSPSRRSSASPTCSTWPRMVEGRLSQPAAVGPRAGARRCTRPRRSAAGPATRPAPGSTSTRASTAAATPARSAGSTPRGNGTFAVSIRCAEIDGTTRPPRRRQRHRRRHRPRHRAGRDPGQAPGHAQRALVRPLTPADRGRRDGWRVRRGGDGVGDGGVESVVDVDVGGAVGADATSTWTPPAAERGSRPPGRRRRPSAAVDAVGRGPQGDRGRRRAACRRAARSARRPTRVGLRQEREDAAAVVVDHDDHEVDAALRRRRAGRCCRGGRRGRR